MKNQILTLAVLSATSLTFLTACGSGDKARIGSVLSNPVASVSDRIASYRVSGSLDTKATFEDSSDDNVNISIDETQNTFSVRGAGNDRINATLDGESYFLTRDASNNYNSSNVGVLISGVSSVFSSNNSDPANQITAGTHSTIQGTYLVYATGTSNLNAGESAATFDFILGYATMGVQTTSTAVESQSATATYSGDIEYSTSPITIGSYDASETSASAEGTLTMNVDFNANTISGRADFDNSGRATFATAPIVGNGFAGTFSLDNQLRSDSGLTSVSTGNYAGNFFGSGADDLAGVMRFTGANSAGIAIGIGGFRGDRQ